MIHSQEDTDDERLGKAVEGIGTLGQVHLPPR